MFFALHLAAKIHKAMLRILFFILAFICSFSLAAQDKWTLQQCVDYALSHNLQIKQSELSSASDKISVSQSSLNLLPTVNGNAGQSWYFGRNVDPYTNDITTSTVRSNNFGANGSLTIFDGLQLQNTLRQSKLNYLSSQYDLKKIQNDIALNVVTAFLQVMYAREQVTISNDQFGASKIQFDKSTKMYELGSVAKSDLLYIESLYANDEVNLINAQSQVDQALLSLKQLLELDSVNNFDIAIPSLDPPNADVMSVSADQVYVTALGNQPDIKSYEYKVAAAQKGLSIAKGGLSPRLSLGGSLSSSFSNSAKSITGGTASQPSLLGYTTTGDEVYSLPGFIPVFETTDFKDQLNDNLNRSISLSLSIPLFNGLSAHHQIKRARISASQADIGFQQTKNALRKSVAQALLDAQSGYKKFIAAGKSLSATEEAFKNDQKKYDLGLINYYDYVTSKNNFAKAAITHSQAKYDYIFKIKVLDFYQGKSLTF